MDDDRFRPLFGFRGSNFGSSQRSPPMNPFEEEDDDSQTGNFGDDLFSRFRFGNFGRSSGNDMNDDIFRGAETMLRHMDAMFRDMTALGSFGGSGVFGQILGPGLDDQRGGSRDSGNPYIGGRRSPRDEMLKLPDSDASVTVWDPPVDNQDVETGRLASEQALLHKNPQLGGWPNWSGSSSVTTVSGFSDGKMEEKRTIQHSDGSKSVVVTRRMGDKELKVTTKTHRTGESEVIEDLINMNEAEKADFNLRWTSKSPSKSISGNEDREKEGGRQVYPAPAKLDPNAPSIFSNIFGSWFK